VITPVSTSTRILLAGCYCSVLASLLGGLAPAAFLILQPGGFGSSGSEDPYILLCAILVPLVGTVSFCQTYRAWAPNNRWKGS